VLGPFGETTQQLDSFVVLGYLGSVRVDQDVRVDRDHGYLPP
jgi:hypothetical protein